MSIINATAKATLRGSVFHIVTLSHHMGIRGLAQRLNKSAIQTTIGCSSIGCHILSRVVIDGPSLAYWIYDALVRTLADAGGPYEQPSYGLVSSTILKFLDELERCHVCIQRIYFDGALPSWKQSTRLIRLRQDYGYRRALKQRNTTGLKLDVKSEARISIQALLNGLEHFSKPRSNASLAFLVPLVIEGIKASRFAEKLEVVPGEADPWCAAFAKKDQALILTSDSDLAIYDVDKGQAAFLSSLTATLCHECNLPSITARILQPANVAHEFLSPDIQHAAYRLQQETTPNSSHRSGGRHLGQPFHNRHVLEHATGESFGDFMNKYPVVDLSSDNPILSVIQQLDPRLSEIVVQILEADAGQINIMLPSLMDDPERAAAWKVSEDIRSFVYALLLRRFGRSRDLTLAEHVERGQVNGKAKFVRFLTELEVKTVCKRIQDLLQLTRGHSEMKQCNVTDWQTTCCVHVIHYLMTKSNCSEGDIRSSLLVLFKDTSPQFIRGWLEIHLQAQFEATYYAFRQLHQTLHLLSSVDKRDKADSLADLYSLDRAMEGFPGILDMFLCSHRMVSVDVDVNHAFIMAKDMVHDQDYLEK